ncbi:MAG TPA: tyrosine protein kinase, partial [Algoriphagus sp.]|nr:tyrosine protein kinase [Algoriphagus sp.]
MNEFEDVDFSEKPDKSIDFKSILPKILRIWPWIILSVGISLAIGFYLTKTTVPLFSVSSKFFIKEKESAFALFEKPSITEVGNVGLQNEIIILKSRPIAEATLKTLDFDVEYFTKGTFIYNRLYKNTPILVQVDWLAPQVTNGLLKISWENNESFTVSFEDDYYTKYLPDGTSITLNNIPKPESFKFGDWVETINFRLKISKVDPEKSGEIYVKVRDINSLVNQFSNSLRVSPVERGASIMNLSINTTNVAVGEVYLNSLMDTYLTNELEEKNEVYSNTIKFIDDQVSGIEDSLRFFERQLESFRSQNRFFDLSAEGSAVFSQLSELGTQLNEEKFKRTYYQSLKDYLVRENYRDLVVPSGIGIDDPILNAQIENLLSLQVDKSRLLATQTEISPAVKEVNRKIADLNETIREVLTNVDDNARRLIADLERRISETEKSFRNLPQTEQNLIRIERQFKLYENLYTFLMERRSESAITKASNKAANKIIERASGGYQLSPRPIRNYLGFALAGVFIPI